MDADYLGAADFHTSSPGYIIDFVIGEDGVPRLELSVSLPKSSSAETLDGLHASVLSLKNGTLFQYHQGDDS